MKKLSLFVLGVVFCFSASAQTRWAVDPMHSFVNFSVKHMGISFVDGSFRKFDGSLTAAKPDFSDAKVSFTVDVNSINTSVEPRDKHLKSDDFFAADKYPAMTFESTSFKKRSGNNYELNGKLTIKDVTKDVRFDVVFGGTAKDQRGGEKAGFSATTTINRLDYNIKYDPTGMGVSKDVTIRLNLEFAPAK
ncbi:polyisoprenoid-binding protein [Pedobacter yulinensis]|uniref:Polyisoprenoid-binding protein n=1 Tax=Pedobacter yulinensis TaxID=2126353 RepID=A0A2T3HRU7_9SPHI|nr:YceI family protein [Pedobacter yulinensis]PST85107.1 polyisoprenoid-binding protein [Pedobacter yulinensis]